MAGRKLKDYDEAYVSDKVGSMTLGGLLVRALGIVIALALVFGVIGFFAGWFNAAKEVVSPANVKAQWQFAYDYDEQLDAIAQQTCQMRQVEAAETDPAFKTQRTSQRVAIEQNYFRVEAEYNGRLRDAFRAKLVAPTDVPDQAPSLDENLAEVGCNA